MSLKLGPGSEVYTRGVGHLLQRNGQAARPVVTVQVPRAAISGHRPDLPLIGHADERTMRIVHSEAVDPISASHSCTVSTRRKRGW